MALHLVALVVCFIWGTSVAMRDLSTFRISNSSIRCGVLFLWPALYFLNLRVHLNLGLLGISLLVLVLGLTSLIGMGDAKLSLLLAPWINQERLGITIMLLIGISWLQLISISLVQRHFPKRIAFAPAILLAAALNMAT
jgi:Flp pilus assembly protein protease CpaA